MFTHRERIALYVCRFLLMAFVVQHPDEKVSMAAKELWAALDGELSE